ncbi:hypothetical protein EXIGLDRAFT_757022 [Exidia glandulosa HHB12029]|uniref:Uncharacterized protein n=1 Tax=Exidia glandulosa HHB12029 TaxID=1314781 RepID=A0A165ASW0_EXIGL|nr:hypothetical protein EXIGLDRAFT_757022 [Exidia glandulosa HHB12029]
MSGISRNLLAKFGARTVHRRRRLPKPVTRARLSSPRRGCSSIPCNPNTSNSSRNTLEVVPHAHRPIGLTLTIGVCLTSWFLTRSRDVPRSTVRLQARFRDVDDVSASYGNMCSFFGHARLFNSRRSERHAQERVTTGEQRGTVNSRRATESAVEPEFRLSHAQQRGQRDAEASSNASDRLRSRSTRTRSTLGGRTRHGRP